MGGIDFKAPGSEDKEKEDEALVAYNTRLGVVMFLVYLAFYGGFMTLSAFYGEVMIKPFLGGLNLSIVYGFALIVVAMGLALIYMKACRKGPKAVAK